MEEVIIVSVCVTVNGRNAATPQFQKNPQKKVYCTLISFVEEQQ